MEAKVPEDTDSNIIELEQLKAKAPIYLKNKEDLSRLMEPLLKQKNELETKLKEIPKNVLEIEATLKEVTEKLKSEKMKSDNEDEKTKSAKETERQKFVDELNKSEEELRQSGFVDIDYLKYLMTEDEYDDNTGANRGALRTFMEKNENNPKFKKFIEIYKKLIYFVENIQYPHFRTHHKYKSLKRQSDKLQEDKYNVSRKLEDIEERLKPYEEQMKFLKEQVDRVKNIDEQIKARKDKIRHIKEYINPCSKNAAGKAHDVIYQDDLIDGIDDLKDLVLIRSGGRIDCTSRTFLLKTLSMPGNHRYILGPNSTWEGIQAKYNPDRTLIQGNYPEYYSLPPNNILISAQDVIDSIYNSDPTRPLRLKIEKPKKINEEGMEVETINEVRGLYGGNTIIEVNSVSGIHNATQNCLRLLPDTEEAQRHIIGEADLPNNYWRMIILAAIIVIIVVIIIILIYLTVKYFNIFRFF